MRRYVILAIVAATSFAVGYTDVAKAWPYFGRSPNYGYFLNTKDDWGTYVLPVLYDGGVNAVPNYVNTAAELIAFIMDDYNNGTTQEKRGAAFIIGTMTDLNPHDSTPSAAAIADWQSRVNFAADNGWIGWTTSFGYAINSYYQGTGSGTNPADDAFFGDVNTASTITFKTSAAGAWVYGIRRQCANPVGNTNFDNIYDNNFSISGRTTVNDATPAPGQTITFNHYLKNAGPNSTDPSSIIWRTYFSNSDSDVVNIGSSVGYIGSGVEVNVNTENYLVPANAANGTQICRRVAGSPASDDNTAGVSGALVCATVTIDYNLNPVVTPNLTTVQDGDTLTFTYTVNNLGTTPSSAAQCYNKDGGGALVGTSFTCSVSQVFAAGATVTVGTENIPITTQTPGTTICRVLYVQPASPSVASRASTSACAVVAKKPYVRFSGNDLWAGGGFVSANPACNTSAKITTSARALAGTAPTQYAGSSVEYNAFALNKITSFGSAGRVLVGSGALGDLSRSLTFANNEADATKLGYYGAASHCLTDYASLYASATPLAAGTYDVGTRGSGVWRAASGNLHLYGTMPAGATQIYIGVNDLFVDNDLKYPASYANLADVPSLVVITTHNLAIMSNVKQLDGFYVAQGDGVTSGLFRDCWPKTSPQAVGDACDVNQLVVNGAVSAGQFELWRSYGASGATTVARQTPAELFKFTPEIYLRNALNSTNSTMVQVINTIELPPRF